MGPDLVEILIADHREIDDLLTSARSDGRRTLDVAIAETIRHLVVEEDYIYPLIRELLPRGGASAGAALERSERAEALMKQLERAGDDDPDRERLLGELQALMRNHIKVMEGELLPALRQTCGPGQLEHLAGVIEMAKRTAPTRPHPGAPHHPPWNQILTPSIGIIDRIRDAMSRRPTKPDHSKPDHSKPDHSKPGQR